MLDFARPRNLRISTNCALSSHSLIDVLRCTSTFCETHPPDWHSWHFFSVFLWILVRTDQLLFPGFFSYVTAIVVLAAAYKTKFIGNAANEFVEYQDLRWCTLPHFRCLRQNGPSFQSLGQGSCKCLQSLVLMRSMLDCLYNSWSFANGAHLNISTYLRIESVFGFAATSHLVIFHIKH
jgi:hypothetical protein